MRRRRSARGAHARYAASGGGRPIACDERGGRANDRLAAAQAISTKLNAAVVVKGAGSALAYPDGSWDINATGNPGLASAGTGDVLAGFAGAMLAQRVDPRLALRIAVCVHGAAADTLVATGDGPLGLAASELLPVARSLLNRGRSL